MKNRIPSSNIVTMMDHLRLNSSKFADKLKVPRGRFVSYKLGKAPPNVDFVNKICNLFGITTDQFMKQRLSIEDLNHTGHIESVTEVKLQAALNEIELLKKTIADKEEIIELLKENGSKPSRKTI